MLKMSYGQFGSGEVCSRCNEGRLMSEGDSDYCPVCQKYFDKIEFEIENKFAPNNNNIFPQANDMNADSRTRNARKYINQFTQKFGVNSRSEVDILVNEVHKYFQHYENKKCASYRQLCAALFFYNYRREFKIFLHDFCKEWQLQTKKFNKSLLNYVAFRNGQTSNDNHEEFKQLKEEPEDCFRSKCEEFLNLISKQLFSFLVHSKGKLEQIICNILDKIKQNQHEELNIDQRVPLVIFKTLKELNHPISFRKYQQLCKKNGLKLSKTKYTNLKKNQPTEKNKKGGLVATSTGECSNQSYLTTTNKNNSECNFLQQPKQQPNFY